MEGSGSVQIITYPDLYSRGPKHTDPAIVLENTINAMRTADHQ